MFVKGSDQAVTVEVLAALPSVADVAELKRKSRRSSKGGHGGGTTNICLIPQLASAERFRLDISGLTRLQDIRSACLALPAFADADPMKQPDAERAAT